MKRRNASPKLANTRRMEKVKKCLKFIVTIAILILIIVFIVNKVKNSNSEETSDSSSYESEVIKQDILNTLSSSSYIQTALEESKSLHATYYLSEIYFETNQQISAGDKLIKYTNGKYLKAPYNCIVTDYSLPDENEVCTNNHYITIQSTDSLMISMTVSEDELSTVYVGQEARVEVDILEDKEIVGYVTNIGNSATYSSSGSSFPVTVEFENDGELMIGLSAKCSIVLEKAEDAITVASEAITEENGVKYVTVKNSDGTTQQVEIETGISNDAYTEVKSGLSEGDIVIITEEDSSSSSGMTRMGGDMQGGGFEMDSSGGGGSDMQMPSGGDMPSDGGGFSGRNAIKLKYIKLKDLI